MEIKHLLKNLPQKEKNNSERSDLIKEIYSVYCSDEQRIIRKKTNWKRYIEWLKENKFKDSKDAQEKFKKHKSFIKEKTIGQFCFFISVIPQKDLPYILSVGKNMNNRNENFGGWLMANLTGKFKSNDIY